MPSSVSEYILRRLLISSTVCFSLKYASAGGSFNSRISLSICITKTIGDAIYAMA